MRVKDFASAASILFAVIYLGSKVLSPATDAVDFKYFWLAGSLWHDGINPYGPAYIERARELFEGGGSIPQQWAYPPHFRPVAELMALKPFETSTIFWRCLFVLAIAGGTVSLFAAVRTTAHFPAYVVMLFLTIALTLSATATTIVIGQSSAILFLGYCLFIYGYLNDKRAVLCLALILLMIKPTYGFIPAFFLLAHPPKFGLILMSAVITVVISVWGLWGHELQETIAGFRDAFSSYRYNPVNLAPEMTGLRHLIYFFGFGETSQLAYVLAGSILAFGLGLFVYFNDLSDLDRIRSVVLLGLLVLAFAPMHTYDGFFTLAVVIPALALSRFERLIFLPLLLIVWRSNNLAAATGLKLPETEYNFGSSVESFSTAATLVCFILVLAFRYARRP